MIYTRFAVAAIALATVAVALQDVIKECCTRAHARRKLHRLSLQFGITTGQ